MRNSADNFLTRRKAAAKVVWASAQAPSLALGRKSRRLCRRGFTLLEVMLAVAIVGTALFSIALAIGRCMDAARQTGNYTTAHDLAEAKLMEFANATNFFLGVSSGECDPTNFPGFQWQREIVADDSQLESLYRQTLTVTWKDRGKDYDVTLTSMLYNPNVTSDGTSTGDMSQGSAPRSSNTAGRTGR